MAGGSQGWSKWYDDAPTHPKFLVAGHQAGWLYVCGQAYCSKHALDGVIPKAMVVRLTDLPSPMKSAARLVAAGLWHDEGDNFVQHDYTEMQATASERVEKREQARERQRRSREAKAGAVTRDKAGAVTRDKERDESVTHASVTLAETETETETELDRADPPSAPPGRKTVRPAGWEPNQAHKAKALTNGVSLDHEADQFRSFHDAKGSKFASWDAAFHTWLGNARKFARSNVRPLPSRPRELGPLSTTPGPARVVASDYE